MAEHVQGHSDMDYAEHERTYRTFTAAVEVGVVACLNIVLVIALWGLKGSNAWGAIGLILTLVTTGIGLLSPKISWRAGAPLLVIMLIALGLM